MFNITYAGHTRTILTVIKYSEYNITTILYEGKY